MAGCNQRSGWAAVRGRRGPSMMSAQFLAQAAPRQIRELPCFAHIDDSACREQDGSESEVVGALGVLPLHSDWLVPTICDRGLLTTTDSSYLKYRPHARHADAIHCRCEYRFQHLHFSHHGPRHPILCAQARQTQPRRRLHSRRQQQAT
jgi:hypothetical protein